MNAKTPPSTTPDGAAQPIPSGASQPFLTVGQLREAMDGLPDDAAVYVTASLSHTYDQGIVEAEHSRLIEWDHDCTDAPEDHRPGQDCPTRVGLELWINSYEEAMTDAHGNAPSRSAESSDAKDSS